MAVVLDAAHVSDLRPTSLGDELLDKGRLAGIMTPDDGAAGLGNLIMRISFRTKKYSTRFPMSAPRTRPDPSIPCARLTKCL